MIHSKDTGVVRLREDQLEALAKKLPPIVVSDKTTELQAGFQLGVQAVLQKLREGFTVYE